MLGAICSLQELVSFLPMKQKNDYGVESTQDYHNRTTAIEVCEPAPPPPALVLYE